MRVMRQPASIDEELAVPPHPVAQRFEARAENDVGAKLNEVFQGNELLLAAIHDHDVAAARAEEAVRAKELLLGGEALVAEPDLIPLIAGKWCAMRGDDGIPRTGSTERPAHHGGVGSQYTAAGVDRSFAYTRQAVALEDFEFATVQVLTRHVHLVGSFERFSHHTRNDVAQRPACSTRRPESMVRLRRVARNLEKLRIRTGHSQNTCHFWQLIAGFVPKRTDYEKRPENAARRIRRALTGGAVTITSSVRGFLHRKECPARVARMRANGPPRRGNAFACRRPEKEPACLIIPSQSSRQSSFPLP